MNSNSDDPDNRTDICMEEENAVADTDMNGLLRQLRLRRMQAESDWSAAPTSSTNDKHKVANEDEDGDEEEADTRIENLLEELSNEVRRMGREIFKTNRAADRQQELFTEALTEIRQLSSVIAQVPQQNAAQLSDAQFEAKATICRELLRLTDTLETSLHAADDLIARLQIKTQHAPQGVAAWFAATRDLHASLAEAALALRQWSEGQRLQAARLQTILQTAGVRALDTVGRAFDPTLHRAVATEQRPDLTPGTIVGEELKGYVLDGRILRYAEVVVARHE
ncbi:MAG TPA: nucleotide exchange factor GrpE [Blastocatellia bacterium]|nr:nucleotide exchange factor GrpE [Blastocatellia bacterium]